jgi:four helix bundle protein
VRYLRYSVSSASELEYHILLARDKRAIADEDHDLLFTRIVEVRKMLSGLIAKLKSDQA